MPVVINEFEVLPEPQADTRKAPAEGANETAPARPLEADAVAATLRALERRALRTWAH